MISGRNLAVFALNRWGATVTSIVDRLDAFSVIFQSSVSFIKYIRKNEKQGYFNLY